MFCKYCGRENPDGAKFCGGCGRELKAAAGAAAGNRTAGTAGYHTAGAGTAAVRYPQGLKPKTKYNIGHAGVMIAAVLLILSLFIPNTAENALRRGADAAGRSGSLGGTIVESLADGMADIGESTGIYNSVKDKSILENIGILLDEGGSAIVLFVPAATILLAVCAFISALCKGGLMPLICSILNILPSVLLIYICTMGKMQIRGAGYWVFTISAGVMFLSALTAFILKSNSKA